MLRQSVKVSAELKRGQDGVGVEVSLHAEGVGHRVPTGFIDRHLILSVEGRDAKGKTIEAIGPKLPGAVGRALADRPGRLFAKLLKDEKGHSPAPFWKANLDPEDTRLHPDREERSSFRFTAAVRTVRVQLLYRRFWQEVADTKGWRDSDVVVFDRTLRVE